jgi:hypothetical protein
MPVIVSVFDLPDRKYIRQNSFERLLKKLGRLPFRMPNELPKGCSCKPGIGSCDEGSTFTCCCR